LRISAENEKQQEQGKEKSFHGVVANLNAQR
jgi:hypothetical protein